LKEIIPHQAYTTLQEGGDMVKDGESCVAATPYLDIAIFKALITKGESSFSVSATSTEDVTIEFTANEEAIKTANGKKAFIYVLNKTGFTPRSGNNYCMEWRSSTSVKPLWMFEVNFEDLPQNIEIIK